MGKVIIFTGGRLRNGPLLQRELDSADAVIAADSGAETAIGLNIFPSVVIGDFDSLDKDVKEDLEAMGARFIVHDRRKDRTDTELAIDYAVREGADSITIAGGIEGDRIDHVMANVLVAAGSKVPIAFVNGPAMAWAAHGPRTERIRGRRGDRLSLIPLTRRVTGVTTSGLEYPLKDESLRMDQGRGVSNVMTRTAASVALARGTLLFVHDARPE